jgi:hypothetical protein
MAANLTLQSEIMAALSAMHPAPMWAFLPELRCGTGYGNDREKRIDAWAICCYPKAHARTGKAPFLRRSFELKVSKPDLDREGYDPDKRWLAMAYSNEFYFVAPAGLVDIQELDEDNADEGVIEFADGKCRIVRKAKCRTAMPPKWEFVAALCRRIGKSSERETETVACLQRVLDIAAEGAADLGIAHRICQEVIRTVNETREWRG